MFIAFLELDPRLDVRIHDRSYGIHHMQPRSATFNDPTTQRLRTGSHVSDDEIRQAEEKFAESLHLAQMGMFNLLENDVSWRSTNISRLSALLQFY